MATKRSDSTVSDEVPSCSRTPTAPPTAGTSAAAASPPATQPLTAVDKSSALATARPSNYYFGNDPDAATKPVTAAAAPPVISSTKSPLIRTIRRIDIKKLQESGLDHKISEALVKSRSKLPAQGASEQAASASSLSYDNGIKATALPSTSTEATTSSRSASESSKSVIVQRQTSIGESMEGKTDPETVTADDRLEHAKYVLNKMLLKKQEDIRKVQSLSSTKAPATVGANKSDGPLTASPSTIVRNSASTGKPKAGASNVNIIQQLPSNLKVPGTAGATATQNTAQQQIERVLGKDSSKRHASDVITGSVTEITGKTAKAAPKVLNYSLPIASNAIISPSLNVVPKSVEAKPPATKKSTGEKLSTNFINFMNEKSKSLQNSINDRKAPLQEARNKEGNFQTPTRPPPQSTLKAPAMLSNGVGPQLAKVPNTCEFHGDFQDVSSMETLFPKVVRQKNTPLPSRHVFYNPNPKETPPDAKTESRGSPQYQPHSFLYPSQVTPLIKATGNPVVSFEKASPSNNLIVLENKVLSQDEKIDLTSLGFGTPKMETIKQITAPPLRTDVAPEAESLQVTSKRPLASIDTPIAEHTQLPTLPVATVSTPLVESKDPDVTQPLAIVDSSMVETATNRELPNRTPTMNNPTKFSRYTPLPSTLVTPAGTSTSNLDPQSNSQLLLKREGFSTCSFEPIVPKEPARDGVARPKRFIIRNDKMAQHITTRTVHELVEAAFGVEGHKLTTADKAENRADEKLPDQNDSKKTIEVASTKLLEIPVEVDMSTTKNAIPENNMSDMEPSVEFLQLEQDIILGTFKRDSYKVLKVGQLDSCSQIPKAVLKSLDLKEEKPKDPKTIAADQKIDQLERSNIKLEEQIQLSEENKEVTLDSTADEATTDVAMKSHTDSTDISSRNVTEQATQTTKSMRYTKDDSSKGTQTNANSCVCASNVSTAKPIALVMLVEPQDTTDSATTGNVRITEIPLTIDDVKANNKPVFNYGKWIPAAVATGSMSPVQAADSQTTHIPTATGNPSEDTRNPVISAAAPVSAAVEFIEIPTTSGIHRRVQIKSPEDMENKPITTYVKSKVRKIGPMNATITTVQIIQIASLSSEQQERLNLAAAALNQSADERDLSAVEFLAALSDPAEEGSVKISPARSSPPNSSLPFKPGAKGSSGVVSIGIVDELDAMDDPNSEIQIGKIVTIRDSDVQDIRNLHITVPELENCIQIDDSLSVGDNNTTEFLTAEVLTTPSTDNQVEGVPRESPDAVGDLQPVAIETGKVETVARRSPPVAVSICSDTQVNDAADQSGTERKQEDESVEVRVIDVQMANPEEQTAKPQEDATESDETLPISDGGESIHNLPRNDAEMVEDTVKASVEGSSVGPNQSIAQEVTGDGANNNTQTTDDFDLAKVPAEPSNESAPPVPVTPPNLKKDKAMKEYEEINQSVAGATISLKEVIERGDPGPVGPPKLPFKRKIPQSSPEVATVGIKSLLRYMDPKMGTQSPSSEAQTSKNDLANAEQHPTFTIGIKDIQETEAIEIKESLGRDYKSKEQDDVVLKKAEDGDSREENRGIGAKEEKSRTTEKVGSHHTKAVKRKDKSEKAQEEDVHPRKRSRLNSKEIKDQVLINSATEGTDMDISNEDSYDDDDETPKEESSQELTVRTNRKRLRKTVEIKKTRVSVSESDSEDDRELPCNENSNEFRGFDEDNQLTKAAAPGTKESCDEKQRKSKQDLHPSSQSANDSGGSFRNLFTSGDATIQRIPLKKRWELTLKPHEETDITDDTSPADDEDEEVRRKKHVPASSVKTDAVGGKPRKSEQTSKANKHENTADEVLPTKKLSKSKKVTCVKAPGGMAEDETSPNKAANKAKVAASGSKRALPASADNSESEAVSVDGESVITAIPATPNSRGGRQNNAKNASSDEQHSTQTKKKQFEQKASHETMQFSSPTTRRGRSSNVTPSAPSVTSTSITAAPAATADPATQTHSPKDKPTTKSNSTPSEFNPRLLLIRNRAQLDTDEVLTEETTAGVAKGTIKCGLCLARMKTAKWTQHLAEHYGVGWKVGQHEINVNARSSVLAAITNFFKSTSIKGLKCRLCARLYRSALGLLLHLETCGAGPQRVTCDYCGKEYSKLSMGYHMRTCGARNRGALKDAEADKMTDSSVDAASEVLNNSGRVKRASTMRAESKLKAIGEDMKPKEDTTDFDSKDHVSCQPPHPTDNYSKKWSLDLKKFGKAFCPQKLCKFSADTIKELLEHLADCKHTIKPGYYCSVCKKTTVFATENAAVQHVDRHHNPLTAHNDFEGDASDCGIKTDDDTSDDDDISSGANSCGDQQSANSSPSASKGKKRSRPTNPMQMNKVYSPRCPDITAYVHKKWTDFTRLNYTVDPLYSFAVPLYEKAPHSVVSKFKMKTTTSMKFALDSKMKFKKQSTPAEKLPWSDLKPFEIAKMKNDQFIFVGGPVKAVAWVPLPSQSNKQYLAVTYRRDIDLFTRYANPNIKPDFIVLIAITTEPGTSVVARSEVAYAIHIPDGPVHAMAFLPSGGYDSSTNRLGLLAVGTATSSVNIYALPIQPGNEECANKESTDVQVLDLKATIVLKLDVHSADSAGHPLIETQCTMLCWSETSVHNFIFGSFGNGCLAIWDIADEENLNCFIIQNNLRHFAPLNYFYVGERNIRSFAVHYDTSGPRWLAVASVGRKVIIYDLRNMVEPTIVKEENCKALLRTLDWSPIWEPVTVGYCDTIPNGGRCVVGINPLNIMFHNIKIDTMLCGISDIHYNPLQNIQVCVTDNGDIVFLNPREYHFEDVLPNSLKNARAVSMMDVKCLNGESVAKFNAENLSTSWKLFEEDYKQKYGLIFGPVLKFDPSNKSTYIAKERTPPVNVMRYMRITCVRCNLNPQAHQMVAAGYENGFLRLVHFDRNAYFN